MTFKEFKKTLTVNFVGVLGAIILKLLFLTYRFKVVFQPHTDAPSKDFVLAFWHGDQLVMPYLRKHMAIRYGIKTFEVLISAHTDGRIVARAMRCFGIGSIEGSSTRGGKQAMIEIVRRAPEDRHAFVFTPDGPRGPVHKVKEGVIFTAKKTNRAIIPAAAFARRAWKFNSWDSMMLPKPFAQVCIVVGSPLVVDETSNCDELGKQALEEALNTLSKESAALCA